MKPVSVCALLALLVIVGCAPVQTYYQPGVTLAMLNRTTTACQVQAIDKVPPSTAVRREPPIFIPGRRICDKDGKCRGARGYYIPGGIETYDPNAGLRLRVERQCMADRGYVPVSIPHCPDSVVRAAPRIPATRLPALSEGSCVIRYRDGSIQIVTRG